MKARPLPKLRVQISFERSFTEVEFLRLKRGLMAENMRDRWHIFYKEPWLYFVRSWTRFCIYKVRLKKSENGCRVTAAFASRDSRQYGGTDAREDARTVSRLINEVLLS